MKKALCDYSIVNIINLTILECKFLTLTYNNENLPNNKSNHIGM